MNLATYQRLLVGHLLGSAEHGPPALGDARRLALYRAMAQRRLLALGEQAFRSTRAQLGNAQFRQTYARYLAEHPPRTPLLRDTALGFAPFVAAHAVPGAPPFLPSLAAFEAALWQALYAEASSAGPVLPLDFARPPVFAAANQVFRAPYAVHRRRLAVDAEVPAGDVRLLIFRDAQDRVQFAEASALLVALFEAARAQPAQSLTALVQGVAPALGRALDEALLADLSDGLTSALACGALLGSR